MSDLSALHAYLRNHPVEKFHRDILAKGAKLVLVTEIKHVETREYVTATKGRIIVRVRMNPDGQVESWHCFEQRDPDDVIETCRRAQDEITSNIESAKRIRAEIAAETAEAAKETL